MGRLEDKIIEGLRDIGYHGPLLDKFKLNEAVELGQKSLEYTKLVSFLTREIRTLLGVDEEVNAITSPENSVEFILEITSFLKELNCPYSSLTQGLVSERLQNVSDRLLLLDYLITELMGARILQDRKPEKKIELKLQETSEGADMRLILQTLRFPKPPGSISVKQLFDKLDTTVPIVLKKANADLVGNGIFNGYLSNQQWQALTAVQEELLNEYKIRREMMLTRLDVTIQSFQWSDKTKGKDELFENIYHEKRKLLQVEPEVDLSDLLAARTDLAIIEKTSSSSVRKNTRTALNKVIIGQVPDRGGRSWEQAPPPPEMPSWQQRSTGPTGGGGGRGGQSNFSRGGGGANRGGNQRNDFQGGRGGGPQRNDYQGGGNQRGSYQGGASGGGYNNTPRGDYKQSFDSRSSSGGGSYQSFDSAGGYSNRDRGSYRGGRGGYDNDNGSNYSGGGGNRGYEDRGNYGSYGGRNDSYGGGRGSFDRRDSGGSYGSPEYQQNKRPKTYDSFQSSKATYADQYVQEREHNQQYGGRRDNYQRGRSSYHRGGGYR